MNLGPSKKFAWACLLLGFGATYFFFLIVSFKGFPPTWNYAFWPGVGLLICLASALRLRKLYGIEPPAPPGQWRLTLVDLLFLSLCSATVLALLKNVLPEDVFPGTGPMLSLLAGVLYCGGLLAASLHGIFHGSPRYLLGFIYAVRSVGWMGVGALAIILVIILFDNGPEHCIRFLAELFALTANRDDFFTYLRIALFAWPVGAFALKVFMKHHPVPAQKEG